MPTRQVKFKAGTYYHIYNRGAGRHNIFIERTNYLYVIRKIKEYQSKLKLSMIVYALLPNHYHFLVRQDGEISAGKLPTCIFGGYSRAVNRRYGWSGTLFEGRYKAKPVESEEYLRKLCRYIHLNPVKHGLVKNLEDWPFSNYLDWVGLRRGQLVDRPFIKRYFGDVGAYKAFLEDGLTKNPGNFEFPGF